MASRARVRLSTTPPCPPPPTVTRYYGMFVHVSIMIFIGTCVVGGWGVVETPALCGQVDRRLG
jgi:hypothetical protein